MCKHCIRQPDKLSLATLSVPVDFRDIGEVRKLLPHEASLSDVQIAEIRDLLLRVADAIYDRWLRTRIGGQPTNLSHNSSEGGSPSFL
jgi:hypothetical protein